jgi:pimeloyl-ACP methyl ester carboxylesterase
MFYREAGPKDGPTILLLHGLPSSSRMFEPLFTRLSDRYHLVAPDYPGFGHSDWPNPRTFAYTFDDYAKIMNHFTEALGLSRLHALRRMLEERREKRFDPGCKLL